MKISIGLSQIGIFIFLCSKYSYITLNIKKGKHIGVIGNKVLVYGDELGNVLNDTVKTLLNEETEIVSLYYGNNLTADEAQEYADKLRLELSEVEVEIYEGQQPHYYFLISVE